MPISEMTARELRTINPTADHLHATVAHLFSIGWKFQPDNSNLTRPPYSWGWWYHPENTRGKNRPCGDPGDFHFKAWDALKAYVAQ